MGLFKMSDPNINLSFGGFFGNLTIAFIVLKIIGKITWSWFWVLSPIIAFGIISIFFIIIILIISAIRSGY